MSTDPSERCFLPADALGALIVAMGADGRQVIGPTPRDGAIMLDALEGPQDLPWGWTDDHAPGRYRLSRGAGGAFSHTVGPDSFKKHLWPARQRLFQSRRTPEGFAVEPPPKPRRLAFLGARACDLAAIRVQDRVLLDSGPQDPHYASRREGLLLVAVQCGQAGATCFCASMDTGPRVTQGYDLALTEVEGGFVVEIGTPAGAALLRDLPVREVDGDAASAPEAAAARATADMAGRALPTEGLRERLLDALEGPHWDKVASRCLGCANCTLVCPTCFCTTVHDVTDLAGDAERVRTWDSCFNLEFSYVHGGPVRATLAARYRQWLTHKLATWWDQFGASGCVGCGRCTTWCPAGIDIVEEALAAAGPGE
ncbi:MAG: 4Fe-4S dicluster domain-containing protein [Alphaproteobacteria bacterium]|nr:4Fe-4S dicluster domain-containing protein [Alphaproteobacteria bacterium]